MVLAALAIVWAVVLGSYAKDRLASRRHDTVSSFRTQLSTLQRTQPGATRMSARTVGARNAIRCETARCRRRNALVLLAGLAVTSLVTVALVPAAFTVGFAVLCTGAFVGYVGLLVQRQRIITEQRAKVRVLHARRAPAPAAAHRPRMVASSRR